MFVKEKIQQCRHYRNKLATDTIICTWLFNLHFFLFSLFIPIDCMDFNCRRLEIYWQHFLFKITGRFSQIDINYVFWESTYKGCVFLGQVLCKLCFIFSLAFCLKPTYLVLTQCMCVYAGNERLHYRRNGGIQHILHIRQRARLSWISPGKLSYDLHWDQSYLNKGTLC